MLRLQKYLADCGVASRRGAEELIKQGRVSVNGEAVREMGIKVDEDRDIIEFDGEIIRPQNKMIYVMLHKPAGFVTTVSDDKGRETVMSLVSEIPARIYPVGRLDYDTEGLLLLTNDGEMTYKITHPKNNIEKTYEAEVTGNITMDTITRLRNGVVLDGRRTEKAAVEVIGATRLGTKLRITIHEGRNRQVRRMFEAVGCIVKRLIRVEEAGLKLGHLPLGKWRRLSDSEVNMLKKIGTGKKSSAEASRSILGKGNGGKKYTGSKNGGRNKTSNGTSSRSGNGKRNNGSNKSGSNKRSNNSRSNNK